MNARAAEFGMEVAPKGPNRDCRHLVDPERPNKTRCGQVIVGDRKKPLETTETLRGGDCNGCRKLHAFGRMAFTS